MMIARSIALHGDLDLADDYADPHPLLGDPIAPGGHARPGRDGVLRPVHDAGLPLLGAPLFLIAYRSAESLTPRLPQALLRKARLDQWMMLRQIVSLGMILVTALLARVFFDAALDQTGRPALAQAATVLLALSPPVLGLACAFFTEVPSALVVLLCWRMLDRSTSPVRAFCWGLATGLLLLIHTRNIGLVVGLLIVAGLRLRARPRLLASGLAGAALMLAARTALTLSLWGTLLTTPLATPGAWPGLLPFLAELGTRVLGLLVDQEHGLLIQAPLYALVAAGAGRLARRRPEKAREIAILVTAYVVPILLPMVNTQGWRGGWSPAARFLVPIAPLLALLSLEAAAVAGHALLGALVALQLLIDLVFWTRPMLLWSDGVGRAPFLGDLAEFAPSVGFGSPLPALAVLASVLALTFWLVRGPAAQP
jgi:hypothetical protein